MIIFDLEFTKNLILKYDNKNHAKNFYYILI